tara:strand:- start:32424 stop:32627 length:204 start_codon:yes stop_codon:yes gene_type:complete
MKAHQVFDKPNLAQFVEGSGALFNASSVVSLFRSQFRGLGIRILPIKDLKRFSIFVEIESIELFVFS